jgi:hypothetical protein
MQQRRKNKNPYTFVGSAVSRCVVSQLQKKASRLGKIHVGFTDHQSTQFAMWTIGHGLGSLTEV